MNLDSRALALACALAAVVALGPACSSGTDDIHQTAQVTSSTCYSCHSTAYTVVQTPVHLGVYPTTCSDCHSTSAWIPATGHPEAKFPITTGSHANAGITCNDCHIASLGSDALGQNTDCTHCHLGAHNAPAIDSVHTGIPNYPGLPASPHSCLNAGCHPSG
jgi:nitrate/TMAO reductase-like tetraheme cytochrome c subunit